MTPERLNEFRHMAARLLEYAANGDIGRSFTDFVHRDEIREGRSWKGYSSCADVAHWLYYRLGVRLDWVNRKEHRGWKDQVNVSRLVGSGIATPYEYGMELDGGDVLIIANQWPSGRDAHVVCVVSGHNDGHITTVEGGQPGVLQHQSEIVGGRLGRVNGKLGSKVRRVLLLEDVLEAAERAGRLAGVGWGEQDTIHS